MREQVEQRIRENLTLIPYTLKTYFMKYYVRQRMREDLMSTGLIGLWKAAENYDPTQGGFSTFAIICIRNEVANFLKVKSRQERRNRAVSLEKPLPDTNDLTLADSLADPMDVAEDLATKVAVQRLLSKLKEEDRELVERHFGFRGQPQSLSEMARADGKTYQAVQQRMKRILTRLQHIARKEGLAEIV